MISKAITYGLGKNFQTLHNFNHLCSICGCILMNTQISNVICDQLARDWNLSDLYKRQFDYREGNKCKKCNASTRIRNLAKTILEFFNTEFHCHFQFLNEIETFKYKDQLVVAEICNCSVIHEYLTSFKNLFYSEFGASIEGVRDENLMSLTYDNDKFDLVLMTDVLEHIPDVNKALSEISRVLKVTGCLIFTIPFLPNRITKKRAEIVDNTIKYYSKKSYHGDYSLAMDDYLVYWEFGFDFIFKLLKFFKTSIYAHDEYGGLISSVIVCKKRK
jgi:SAM-dependent methyltransferase